MCSVIPEPFQPFKLHTCEYKGVACSFTPFVGDIPKKHRLAGDDTYFENVRSLDIMGLMVQRGLKEEAMNSVMYHANISNNHMSCLMSYRARDDETSLQLITSSEKRTCKQRERPMMSKIM